MHPGDIIQSNSVPSRASPVCVDEAVSNSSSPTGLTAEPISPYLRAAIEHCKLPIAVAVDSWHGDETLFQFTVEALDCKPFGPEEIVLTLTPDAPDATRAYFDLVATLESAEPPSVTSAVGAT